MTTKRTAEERAQARFDKEQSYIDFHNHHGYLACIREEVEPLEAENAKLRALVQELTKAGNMMHDYMKALPPDPIGAKFRKMHAWSTAKDFGKPTSTHDNGEQ